MRTSFRELIAEVLTLTAGASAKRGVNPVLSGDNVTLLGDRPRLVG